MKTFESNLSEQKLSLYCGPNPKKTQTKHTRNYKSATQYDAAEDAGRPALNAQGN